GARALHHGPRPGARGGPAARKLRRRLVGRGRPETLPRRPEDRRRGAGHLPRPRPRRNIPDLPVRRLHPRLPGRGRQGGGAGRYPRQGTGKGDEVQRRQVTVPTAPAYTRIPGRPRRTTPPPAFGVPRASFSGRPEQAAVPSWPCRGRP